MHRLMGMGKLLSQTEVFFFMDGLDGAECRFISSFLCWKGRRFDQYLNTLSWGESILLEFHWRRCEYIMSSFHGIAVIASSIDTRATSKFFSSTTVLVFLFTKTSGEHKRTWGSNLPRDISMAALASENSAMERPPLSRRTSFETGSPSSARPFCIPLIKCQSRPGGKSSVKRF